GNGNATFQAPRTSAAGLQPSSLMAGDLNGDGKTDLVSGLSVLLGNGEGTFGPAQALVLPGQFPPGYTGTDPLCQVPMSAALGALNGEGRLDLAFTGRIDFSELIGYDDYGPVYQYYSYTYVNPAIGNGDGSFGPGIATYPSSISYGGIALGDFNGDGRA